MPTRLKAVDSWKREVEDHDVRVDLPGHAHCILPVVHDADLKVFALEVAGDEFRQWDLVVDDQGPKPGRAPVRNPLHSSHRALMPAGRRPALHMQAAS